MENKFEGTPQLKKEIINVDSVEQIREAADHSNFVYKGQRYHKLNESFVVRAKVEGDKVLGDGTTLSIEDIDKDKK